MTLDEALRVADKSRLTGGWVTESMNVDAIDVLAEEVRRLRQNQKPDWGLEPSAP